ncbi:uncharacterized protein EI90DRAFT_1020559 [Cantharellus anzutake]|uniref:uncharacterized protein n=1 Tax=Cantharellus anzutake TaxID=1750568 RepID=UPI0019039364|nr:uncharacterized protein EI90DRAFT_1020559 [Cantharellus anzutake]KAF8331429.1 hypothetical protein EI90DRAFT_1020559 [Cantharellus anzutake]
MYVKSKSECLERTRVQMQASLLERLKASENRFTWLRGSPGTGKTAICMSVASTFNSQGTLAASFFWDKNQAGTGLDSIDHFPSTLAHQLAVFNEDFKMSLVRRLRQPYLGFVKSLPLDKQMDTLVIEPMCNVMGILPSGEGRFIIILDGLDECGNPEALKTLMRLVLKLHDLPSSFAVLVSSRPEMQVIRAWARVQSMGHVIPCEDIDMIDKSETFLTIRRMVVKGLEDCISESLWKPSGKDLDAFALACRELPVIASLRIREVCIRTERGATLKSEFNYFRNLMDAPTGLKSEYLRILRRAYTLDSLPARPSVIENYRLVMGTITAARKPLSVYSIGQLIGITEDEVHATLRPISSIVNLPSTQEGKPHFYHATVKEFNLGAPIDAGDHSFFISDRNGYFLGLPLLQFLRGIFERNELAMPTEGPLGDEEKWKDFQKKERPEHIRYAVKYLFSHLDPSKLFLQDSSELQREFDHLLTHNLLAFMVLSCGEFELPDELLRYNNHSSIELLRETKRVNKYILEYSFQLGRHSSVGNTSARDGSHSFDPWHIFRSVLPFSPPIFGFYHHLSDPVCIFSIYGEFTGHLIPLRVGQPTTKRNLSILVFVMV